MVVAHSMVVSAFHLLSLQKPYQELGANYFKVLRGASPGMRIQCGYSGLAERSFNSSCSEPVT
jgi:hypothetical protein